MSYILDALRRADSERERGAVPNLHANPVALEDDDGEPRRTSPLLWAVVVLSLLLAGVVAWLFLGRDAPEPAPVAAAPSAVVPTPTAAVAPPPPVAESPPVLERRAADVPTTIAPPRVITAPTANPAPRVQAKAQASALIPASAAAERPIATLGDLPESLRRELPQLAVGGAMYSGQASSRMLILNGQVFHEGDTVAAGLVLEQIKLKSAVLAYKGYRYSISY